MKAYGKIAVLALTLAMALALTACGGSGSSSSAAASGSASAASGSATASDSASAASASTGSSSAAASSSAASVKYESGVIQGDTYTNELFGVKFTLPEGFSFYDEAQMADMNKLVGEITSDEDILAALESGVAYFDMVAAAEGGDNLNVVIQYAGTPEAAAIDAVGYLEASAAMVPKQMEGAGMTVKSIETGTYTNPNTGDEFPALSIALEAQGMSLNEKIVCLKASDYFMVATATSGDEANLNTILGNFTLIK